jgi:gliding motility-associated-like protein
MVSDQGCVSTWFSHPVVVSEKPTASFDISKSPICSGDAVSVTFTGTTPADSKATWNWGGGFVKKGTGFGPYNVQYFSSSMLNLTVKNGACTVTSVSKAVTVIPNPIADFTPVPPGGCVPVSVGFVNQSQNADSYQWTFGDGHSATGANAGNTYTSTGSFSVKLVVSSQGMCWDSITKVDIINVSTPPVVAFSAVPDTGTAVEVHLANFVFTNESQYAGSYLWKFGDSDSSTLTNPTHKYNAPGYYRVTLYASNGACMDSMSHEYYKVIPDKVLQIPNAFSPNGDGINDRWDIDGLKQSPGCTVTVFNRWGQEVFKSQGYQSPWDGNYKGKPVPLATYYYIITLPGKTTYNGWVVVLK